MFDFTSEEKINHMVDVVSPVLTRLLKELSGRSKEPHCLGSFDEHDNFSHYPLVPSHVYKKTRDLFLIKLFKEIGLETRSYTADVYCESGVLMRCDGDHKCGLEEFGESLYDPDGWNSTGPFFWDDRVLYDGGFYEMEDLTDYYFSPEGLSYFSIENLSTFEWDEFCKEFPAEYRDIKSQWKTPYGEEMAKALYLHLQPMLAESFSEEVFLSYMISINVAIMPFLKWWKGNYKRLDLRRNKVTNFAIQLIKACKYTGPHSWNIEDCQWGYTDKLFFNMQSMGNSYDTEIFPICFSLASIIGMILIDFVLAYLDTVYGFLPHNIRQMYRDKVKEAANQ